jgi:hypothetical protein
MLCSPATATHPTTIGLRNARKLKQLSFLSPWAGTSLPQFWERLLRELTLDNQAHDRNGPSALEHLTLRLGYEFSVRDVGTAYTRALSDVLADEHHYPNIKQVKLAVLPDCPSFPWIMGEGVDWAGRHREEIARSMAHGP